MYGQMLAALAAATLSSFALFMALPDAALGGLPLPLAPALLCALPLFNPALTHAIEARPELGGHRRRAGQMLARAYLFVLILHTSFAPWLAPVLALILCSRFLLESYRETGQAASVYSGYARGRLVP
jgi:hypothetical protein